MEWWWFVLGAIVGWVASWLLELFWGRRRRQARVTELEALLQSCHEQVGALQGELAASKTPLLEPAPPAAGAAGTAPFAATEVQAARPAARARAAARATTGIRKARSLRTGNEAAVSRGIPAQNLAAIRGIGPVFEQKLYQAHVGTFAELAALSEPQLKAIIQPREWQEFHYETWNEQASILAEKTGTAGAVWNWVIPDDLSAIKGIGEAFEQRLYDAGVLTFTDLAAKSVAELEAIVRPRRGQQVDLARWIAEALMLSGGKHP